MADVCHFEKKTVKSPYLGNRLTDVDEIWHYDVHFDFLKIQDGGGRRLENHKNRSISATV